MYGVGFAVKNDMRDSVMGWMPVNENICETTTHVSAAHKHQLTN